MKTKKNRIEGMSSSRTGDGCCESLLKNAINKDEQRLSARTWSTGCYGNNPGPSKSSNLPVVKPQSAPSGVSFKRLPSIKTAPPIRNQRKWTFPCYPRRVVKDTSIQTEIEIPEYQNGTQWYADGREPMLPNSESDDKSLNFSSHCQSAKHETLSSDGSLSKEVKENDDIEPTKKKQCTFTRKYDSSYIEFGFIEMNDKKKNRPRCIICGDDTKERSTNMFPDVSALYDQLTQEEFLSTLSIHEAAKNGDLHAVKLLLKTDRKRMETVDERAWTPIHLAAAHGHYDIVKYLGENGAHLAALDPSGYTAIHIAAMNGHADCVEVLLVMGCEVDNVTSEGFTPLHLAVLNANIECCQILLSWGANINREDGLGRTVHDMAEEYSLDEVAELLSNYEKKLENFQSILHKFSDK
ncbi:serine/threonine-protein phosphatase 6 regulatory ankyrin repeat subunit A-like, partial [Limulus polyphemus]|uniref:Serine/threonine-protein phosphatase 6 regulatory ankyrin repeat subunit A-like n=1 Tax=Limulus polyphemus TaxID=6850 RepID=A0ABM1RW81_LIMPO